MAGSATMKVEVVSPERVLFSGTASQVITRTESGGEIAFLPGHTSFLGVLTENHTPSTWRVARCRASPCTADTWRHLADT